MDHQFNLQGDHQYSLACFKNDSLENFRSQFTHTQPIHFFSSHSIGVFESCPFFSQDFFPIQLLEFTSVSDAAKKLKKMRKNWFHLSSFFHRRGELISEQIGRLRFQEVLFPLDRTERSFWSEVGIFSLVGKNLLVYSLGRTHLFPTGMPLLKENRDGPPNRAYLKLQEAITVFFSKVPRGWNCIDLGSSPGGWTWVLANLGNHVISVDKAPLEKKVSSLANVEFIQQSAFSLKPKDFLQVRLLVCDVICYPKRLLELILQWIGDGNIEAIIASIKLQGAIDFSLLDQFKMIPNSQIIQLFHNKNELTFFWKKSLGPI